MIKAIPLSEARANASCYKVIEYSRFAAGLVSSVSRRTNFWGPLSRGFLVAFGTNTRSRTVESIVTEPHGATDTKIKLRWTSLGWRSGSRRSTFKQSSTNAMRPALYDDIDYREEPDAPLSGDDARWADALLREGGR